jgi:hypothetical protein
MNKKQEKKMDLLDLPDAERKRFCLEIRASLRERVSIGKIPVADGVIVADKTMWYSPDTKLPNENQKSSDLPKKSSLLNSLAEQVW